MSPWGTGATSQLLSEGSNASLQVGGGRQKTNLGHLLKTQIKLYLIPMSPWISQLDLPNPVWMQFPLFTPKSNLGNVGDVWERHTPELL